MLSDAERRRIYDAYGHEGLSSGGYAPDFEDFGSISDLFSAFFGARRVRRGVRRRRAARGGAVQGGDVARRGRRSTSPTPRAARRSRSPTTRRARCETCHGNGAEPGTPIVTCPRCHGAGPDPGGRSARAFGQLVRTAICDHCGGDGRIAEQPCHTCGGRGHGRRAAPRRGRRPGRDRRRPADPHRRPRPRRRARRPARRPDTWSCASREDERFLRDGEDLVTVVDVAGAAAPRSARTIQVPTLDGDVPVEVPAGTQPGETIALRRPRMPPLGRGRTGDLRVVVNVAIPRRLTARAARAARAARGHADRGQPARGRGHARQAQARARRVSALVRLGIRVRARPRRDGAGRAAAAAAGAAPRSATLGGDVEYAIYAPEGELPDRRRGAARSAGDASSELCARAGPRGLGAALARAPAAGDVEAAGALTIRPPWLAGEPGRPGHRPRRDVRRRHARDDAAVPASCCSELRAAAARCATGAPGSGVLAIAAARLGWGPVTALELDPARCAVIAANARGQRRRGRARARLDLRRDERAVGADRAREPHARAAAPRSRRRRARRRSG